MKDSQKDENPVYCCEYCGKTFNSKSWYTRHSDQYHRASAPKPMEKLQQICEVCGEVCPNKSRLWYHIRMVHKERTHIRCKECNKVFSLKSYYQKHYITTHLKYEDKDTFPGKAFSCPICNKLFACGWKLKWHVRTHTGDKPEICHVCGKRFSYKGNLESHIKIHTDDKPFVCDTCGKRFIHRKELRKHVESHNKGTIPKKNTALKEPISKLDNSDDECEETEVSDNEEYSSESEISDLEESSSESQEMDEDYGETETAVLGILNSKADENVVYEGEYQDTELAILNDSSGKVTGCKKREGGDPNETVTCEEKFKDIEEDMPFDLEENNSALQLLLWDDLVVNDGDVNLPSVELEVE